MRRIAVIYGGNAHQHRTFNQPRYRRWLEKIIYLPEMNDAALDEIEVLLVPSQLHTGLMACNKAAIDAFLKRGGTVVAWGAQPTPLLPGHGWEFRPTNFWWWLEPEPKSGLVLTAPEFGLFQYVTLEDATWHHHGFFHPPAEARIIIEAEGEGAIFYVDKSSTPGTLIMMTLDPEYHYGSYFMPATERFLNGFFPWLAHGEW
ncbi:hypothetical protein [Paenibacillus sanguinis]|uniref:hypothetical protein n=1 Tax=Paenibacillus sanguinis TaxID=225906 RepID=UPI00038059AB|nr:hypothetical protein [Paenibacillus sanguinis]